MQLEVGISYLTRDRAKIDIIKKMTEEDYGWKAGFRYYGARDYGLESDYHPTAIQMYREDGTSFGTDRRMVSSPSDLVEVYKPAPDMINAAHLQKGAIVARLYGGHIISGMCKGWELHNVLSVDYDVYDLLSRHARPDDKYSLRDNELIAISVTLDIPPRLGYIESVVVLYQNDNLYYMGVLKLPHGFADQ